MPPGLRLGWRTIRASDTEALLPAEAEQLGRDHPAVRHRSATARALARRLLCEFGCGPVPLLRSDHGYPVWPEGFVGSLAHDDHVAAAAIGRRARFGSVGVDVEPADPLPRDLVGLVETPAERVRHGQDGLAARALFCVKEAVFKALYPLDHRFLDFQDIEVDLPGGRAATRTGHEVGFVLCRLPRILALATTAPEASLRAAAD